MTLNLTAPQFTHSDFSPKITVIGVGGGGMNAVNNMIEMQLQGVEFVVANTDAQALANARAERRVQLGPHLTQGLGAGAKPEIGRAAAEEAADEIARHIDGAHMIFVTAGMGGGTGTGAAPVIAKMARERKILTVGVVSTPFAFEGHKRKILADAGVAELQQFVDTLIVIPNQNLFRMASERTTLREAFKLADNVLYMGVRGVTDLMLAPGLINLDFADIRTVMAEMGKAMMGTGEAEGDDRAMMAANDAISNPLLDDTSMAGAKGLLINITGGEDMTLYEVDQAAERIRQEVAEDATIIWGSAIDPSLNGRIRVSVVATGIDAAKAAAAIETSRALEAEKLAEKEAAEAAALRAEQREGAFGSQDEGAAETVAMMDAPPTGRLQPDMSASQIPNSVRQTSPRSGLFSGGQTAAQPAQPRGFMGLVTGVLRGRPAQTAPDIAEPPVRAEPTIVERADYDGKTRHDNAIEDEGLDIPAFLRRDR